MSGVAHVNLFDRWHGEEHHKADGADAQFQQGINSQGVWPIRNEARQEQAAQAHPAHECSEQHSERNGGRADHELQELKPDDLVDQCRAAAADEQQEEHRQKRARRDLLSWWR